MIKNVGLEEHKKLEQENEYMKNLIIEKNKAINKLTEEKAFILATLKIALKENIKINSWEE